MDVVLRQFQTGYNFCKYAQDQCKRGRSLFAGLQQSVTLSVELWFGLLRPYISGGIEPLLLLFLAFIFEIIRWNISMMLRITEKMAIANIKTIKMLFSVGRLMKQSTGAGQG